MSVFGGGRDFTGKQDRGGVALLTGQIPIESTASLGRLTPENPPFMSDYHSKSNHGLDITA